MAIWPNLAGWVDFGKSTSWLDIHNHKSNTNLKNITTKHKHQQASPKKKIRKQIDKKTILPKIISQVNNLAQTTTIIRHFI